MVERNNRLRFCGNNFTESADVTVSSEQALYPKSNLLLPQRYKEWSPEGTFVITSQNNIMTVNSITVTLDIGEFTITEFLASVTASLNAQAGASWTFAHNIFTGVFHIAKISGVTLNLSVTANSVWDTIGFIGTTDRTGSTLFFGNQARNHSYEYVSWDLGVPRPATFLSMVAKKSEQFTLSKSATLTLKADNIPVSFGTTAAFEKTITVGEEGVFEFLDDTEDTTYRYWTLFIEDKTNPLGAEGLRFGVVYLGDYVTLDARGLAIGFNKKKVDPSLKNTSESGAIYYKIKNKYWTFSNLSTQFLLADNRRDLEQFFEDKGNHTPFFISLDPTLCASDTLEELTKYVRFEGDPSLTHVKTDTYSMGFNVREDL